MTQFYEIPEFPQLEARNIEGLPPIPLNNTLWHEWEPEVLFHRAKTREETEEKWSGQTEARAREIVRVANDGRYWLSTYGSIYQAKSEEAFAIEDDWNPGAEEALTEGWVQPFIPYVFQLFFWDWQHRAFRTRGPKGDVVVVKSRQMGMSNMLCAFYTWAWMVKKPFQGRLLSRKEDLVDETNNPDSLFWKIDLQLKGTPDWLVKAFMPNFRWPKHRMDASLTNPDNFNHLAGESTNATAGRGPTATGIGLDEFTWMRGFQGIWTATRAASNHRSAVGTVNTKLGMYPYELATKKGDDSPSTLYIPYWLHPYHDDEWLRQERSRDTEAGIQTEVLMNWFGDTADFVYPQLGTKEPGHYPYEPYAGPVFVAIDDGWEGYWAMHIIQYIKSTGRHRIVDSYRNQHKTTDFYGGLLRGIKIDGFDYGRHEDEFMDLMRYIQMPIFVGDTRSKNTEITSGESVYDRLMTRYGIYLNVDFYKRDYQERWDHTAEILPFTDWNDTPRVEQALFSCKRYKWKEIPDGAEMMSWVKEPVKNHDSHDPEALERYGTQWKPLAAIYGMGNSINWNLNQQAA